MWRRSAVGGNLGSFEFKGIVVIGIIVGMGTVQGNRAVVVRRVSGKRVVGRGIGGGIGVIIGIRGIIIRVIVEGVGDFSTPPISICECRRHALEAADGGDSCNGFVGIGSSVQQ